LLGAGRLPQPPSATAEQQTVNAERSANSKWGSRRSTGNLRIVHSPTPDGAECTAISCQEKLTSTEETIAQNTAEAERKLTAVLTVLNQRVKHLEGDNSPTGDEQSQARTPRAGEEDVVVRSP